MQFHFVIRFVGGSGSQYDQCLLSPCTTLAQQRQVQPQWDGGGGQRYANLAAASWGKAPVESRAEIIDLRRVILQPFGYGPGFVFGLGLLEQLPEITRVM